MEYGHGDEDGLPLARMPQPRFAIWLPVFEALMENLRGLPETWEMPEVPSGLRSQEFEDGGAVHWRQL